MASYGGGVEPPPESAQPALSTEQSQLSRSYGGYRPPPRLPAYGLRDVLPDVRPDVRHWAFVTAFFLVVTLLMLHPNPAHLNSDIPANLGDPALAIWIVLWGSHALLTDPLRFFDANIFWPYAHTLAYAETLLPLVPVFGVLHGTTGSWALSLTVLSILLVLLNLLASYALARRITSRTDAAILGALAFGFSSYVLTKWGYVQLQTVGLVPLGLLLLFRLLDRPSMRRAVLLGIVSALVDLTAAYDGAIYAVSVVVIVIAFLVARRRHIDPWLIPCLLVAGSLALVLIAPVAIEYLRLQEQPAFRRSLAGQYVFQLNYFLRPAPGNYLWHWIGLSSGPDTERGGFFPGLSVALLAAAGGLVLGRRARRHEGEGTADERARRELALLALAGLAALILALGPDIAGLPAPYRFFNEHVPGFAGIRAPGRFGVVTLLSIAMLAAYGYARVAERIRPGRLTLLLPVAVGAVILGELASPVPWVALPTDATTLAPYRALAHRPPGAVVELPVEASAPQNALVAAPRMVYSTIDWHPRLNGYSGYFPTTYGSDAEVLAGFPNQASLERLRQRRIRYVILHVGRESGFTVVSPAQAAAMVAALPTGATAAHVGSSWLIDLAGSR
jgi:hypothetical protein